MALAQSGVGLNWPRLWRLLWPRVRTWQRTHNVQPLLFPAFAPLCPFCNLFLCRWMADLIIHWFQQVLHDVATRPLDAEDEEEAQAALGIPMFKVRHCW